MAIAGIGTDIVRVERFREFLKMGKTGIIERIFTPEERAYALGKKDPATHLSARFAAKEAFLKALGLGLREGVHWRDIEVRNDALGKPSLFFGGRAAEIIAERNLSNVQLSYSHEREYAVAMVTVEMV
ncbi:MAG: holo-ACP synthase [Desulfuromonadales bacterium]|nr:holo-ACP synthase [Desulfuromonadales bacterium]